MLRKNEAKGNITFKKKRMFFQIRELILKIVCS